MRRLLAGLLGLTFSLCSVLAAETESSIADKIVNTPAAAVWNVMGAKPVLRDDPAVQSGKALRVDVQAAGVNSWDVQATSVTVKPIKKGDVILVAFWARAEQPAPGRTTALISAINFQIGKAPYTSIFSASARPGPEWKMYYASGVADRDYDAGEIGVTLLLAGARQIVDLGLPLIIDFGPAYDTAKLPMNSTAAAPALEAAAAPPAPSVDLAAAEARFAPELAKLRAMLPVRGRLMNDPAVSAISAYGAGQTSETVAAPDVAGGQALRVHVTAPADSFAIGTGSRLYGDIRKGDVLFLAFYARAADVSNEAQSGVISAYNVQQASSPWTIAVGTAALAPLNSWRLFYASAVAPMDYPSGSANLTAQIGSRKQAIDFGPAFVLNLGPGVKLSALPVNRISYPGREAGAPWRAAAEARIKQIRMGDMKVVVTDAAGKPVPGAAVHVAMTKHLFRFGTFVGHNLANATGPDADKLRESFLKSFNFATTPIYWSDWGWSGEPGRSNYIASMQWLQAHGIAFRAHTVIYPREDLTPTKIKKLAGDPKAVHDAILAHVRDVVPIAAEYGAYAMDVVNEPRDGDYIPKIAGPDIFPDAYKTAHSLAPNVHLFVNDYGIVSGGGFIGKNLAFYHRWIEDMLAKGAPLGGIGIQGHFGADLTDPARVIAVMDEFSKYKLPIEITEFDVDTTDEDAQADYTRDLVTAVFSHPAADAFVMWGWWQGDHWKPDGGMLRRDWSEKLNYKVWMKLTRHDWWTDETRDAAADGCVGLRAFYGDYTVTATAGGRTATAKISFAPGAGPVTVVLK